MCITGNYLLRLTGLTEVLIRVFTGFLVVRDLIELPFLLALVTN